MNKSELKSYQFAIKKQLALQCAKEGDVLGWAKRVFPEKTTSPFCQEMHQYFVDVMYEPLSATLAPRSHGKTMIGSTIIMMFIALNHPDRFLHFLNVQSTSSKATNVNISIKNELETNPMILSMYGDQVTKEKWTEKQFEMKNGVVFSSVGAGESMRGINWKGKRPDYIVVDDIYDDSDRKSRSALLKKEDWFWSALYPARDQLNLNSVVRVQGTAMTREDIYHKAEKNNNFKFKRFKSLTGKIPLWHEAFTYEQLMKEKQNIGSIKFAREMQNEIVDDESSIIKSPWIEFYNTFQTNRTFKVIGAIDPSIGARVENDYTGIAITYHQKINREEWYIRDVVQEHLTLEARLNKLKALDNIYHFDLLYIEAISGFKDFAEYVRRNSNLPVREIVSKKDKLEELEMISSKFENGAVKIYDGLDEGIKSELIYQLTNNHPEHDDIRDAVVQTLKYEECGDEEIFKSLLTPRR